MRAFLCGAEPVEFAAQGRAELDLLADVDKAHGNRSGPATRRILAREYEVHGIAAYERLARISSAQIYRPVLEAMMVQFPFPIRGFHTDNGSEYINHEVSRLLGKVLIEQTKSRSRHCNDNGPVEAKNGAVMRKHLG